VGEIHRGVDEFIGAGFERLLKRMKDEGRIAPDMDTPTLAKVLSVIGDGLFWRRAVDPAFDGSAMLPAVLQVLAGLLKPVQPRVERAETPAETEAAAGQPCGDRS
jgi:hypothetical protein